MILTDLLKRSATTIRANLELARRRHARRRAAPLVPMFELFEFIVISLVIVVLAFLLLDYPVGLARGTYPDWLHQAAVHLTRLGKSDWILIPSGVILILLTFRKVSALTTLGRMRLFRWNMWLCYIFIGVGLPSLISTLVKRIIGRARPVHFLQDGYYGVTPFSLDASYASFPSGHSTTIGALAMVLAIAAPKYRALFLTLALAVGATRIALGAHYPSDVAGGLLFGAFMAYFVARLGAAYGLLFLDNTAPWPQVRPAFRLSRLAE